MSESLTAGANRRIGNGDDSKWSHRDRTIDVESLPIRFRRVLAVNLHGGLFGRLVSAPGKPATQMVPGPVKLVNITAAMNDCETIRRQRLQIDSVAGLVAAAQHETKIVAILHHGSD